MVTLFHSLTCFCHLSLCTGFYGKESGDLFHPELSLFIGDFYSAFTALSYPCGVGKAGGKGESNRAGYGLKGERRKR